LFAPPETKTAVEAEKGRIAHQVAGAMEPSEETKKLFHRYTPAPTDGMAAPVRFLSSLAVSRWGLETLSDLCLHGSHSLDDSAYKIINTISISLHPDDAQKLEEGLNATPDMIVPGAAFPLPSNFWKDKGPYLGIMTGYATLMLVVILFVMKRKDVK
jgi:hypothetical protein